MTTSNPADVHQETQQRITVAKNAEKSTPGPEGALTVINVADAPPKQSQQHIRCVVADVFKASVS